MNSVRVRARVRVGEDFSYRLGSRASVVKEVLHAVAIVYLFRLRYG
jgi:hypothetical protein